MSKIARLSARYYDNQNHRCFPYDGFESLTEAPEPGRKGPILLFSLNNKVKGMNPIKWAWCFVCDEWVQATRRTQHQVMLDYVRRTNVQMRVDGGERQRILALTQRLEEKRRG